MPAVAITELLISQSLLLCRPASASGVLLGVAEALREVNECVLKHIDYAALPLHKARDVWHLAELGLHATLLLLSMLAYVASTGLPFALQVAPATMGGTHHFSLNASVVTGTGTSDDSLQWSWMS